MNDCIYLLTTILGGGELDIRSLLDTMQRWNIDASDVVEDVKEYSDNININALYFSLYQIHVYDLKEQIKELCEDLEEKDSDIAFDEEALDNYEVEIYENFMCTSYDDPYEIWDYDDMDDIKAHKLDQLLDFLVDEDILEIEDICEKMCEEEFDPDDEDEEDDYNNCLDDCDEIDATKDYLKKLIKGE